MFIKNKWKTKLWERQAINQHVKNDQTFQIIKMQSKNIKKRRREKKNITIVGNDNQAGDKEFIGINQFFFSGFYSALTFRESKQAVTRPFSTVTEEPGWAYLHSESERLQVPRWNSRQASIISHWVSRYAIIVMWSLFSYKNPPYKKLYKSGE